MPTAPAWVSVVRTGNLAEAGYLANELEAEGFHSRVEQHDSFSAIDGSWTSVFLIQVPSEEVQESADHLRVHLAETELAQPIAAADVFLDDASQRGAVVWRPIALMIVAGAAILFIGQKMRELRGRQHEPPSRARLMHALENIDRPFVSVDPNHAPNRFRILYSHQARIWRLQEDMDGDGSYDREWRFAGSAIDN
jgi:hypothetical protein